MTSKTISEYAMRSRAVRSSSDHERRGDVLSNKDVMIIERKVKADDTLNKIAIQYSVNVSDIKRANNLVKDQDFVALTVVKIPVSRLRYALGAGSSSSDDEHIIDFDPRASLLSAEKRDPSVEEIFTKTDTAIAQVRETLPEDGVPGTFHFVDASPPDTVCSIWGILIGVVVIFMVIPLLLTIYEENENDDQK
ncbi:LysM domain protein [Dictyocaulus viviparus]|uniref:LysM domain protein n=1 Tax=Dictyocaulus viviparus TaxID=29172 RepID=A0A0D8XNH3_DICVI|nr:LysM domain protein [Dictyocaulus viviparus]